MMKIEKIELPKSKLTQSSQIRPKHCSPASSTFAITNHTSSLHLSKRRSLDVLSEISFYDLTRRYNIMIRRYLWVGSCQKEVHPTETSNLKDYNTMMIRMIFRAPRRMRCKVFFIKPSNLELHYIVLKGAQDCVWVTKTKMDAYHSDSEMPDASVLGDRFDGQKNIIHNMMCCPMIFCPI